MITNRQKTVFSAISFLAIVLGIFTVLPLEILFARMGIETKHVELIELIIKLIILPVIAIGMSVYFMKMRNDMQKEQTDVAVSVIKMCYVPVAIYISGLLGWLGGVIYSSISFSENMPALICIIIAWSASALLIILFGVYTDWLNNVTKKGTLISNIVFLVSAVIVVVVVFLGYKKIELVKTPTELNSFVQLAVYLLAFFAMLLFLWKSIYVEESAPIALDKDEEFTEEEKSTIVRSIIEEEVLNEFDLYYEINKGKYLEEAKAIQNNQDNADGNKEEIKDEE